MARMLIVLLAALSAVSCETTHAHIRAVVHGHNSAANAAKQNVAAFFQTGPADISGKWDMAMETPHGLVKGAITFKVDGAKLSATWDSEVMGPLKITGTVEGKNITCSMQGPQGAFGFKGTIEAKKLSGTTDLGGTWTATR